MNFIVCRQLTWVCREKRFLIIYAVVPNKRGTSSDAAPKYSSLK